MKWLHIGVAIAETHVAWCLNIPERRGQEEGAGGGGGWLGVGFLHMLKVFSLHQACCNFVEVFFNVEQSTLHNHMCLRYVHLLDLDHQIGGISINLPMAHKL